MYEKSQFEKVCIGYLERLTYAEFLCDIHISSHTNPGEYTDKLKIAPNFFEASFNAILHQALLISANFYLFGQTNEFTLHKLLKILESDSHIRRGCDTKELDDFIKKSRKFIDNSEDVIRRLIEWRNRYIAHHDKKYFTDRDIMDSEAIEIDELTALISFGIQFIYDIGKIINIKLEFDDGKYLNDFPKLMKELS